MSRKVAAPDEPPVMTKDQRKKGAMEYFDDTPLAIPLHISRGRTLTDQIRDVIRSEQLRAAAFEQGYESFEEADDFDVGDDYDPRSPHEMSLDQELESYSDYRNQRGVEEEERLAGEGAGKEEEGVRGGGESPDPDPK